MPVISRFLGIIIAMYYRTTDCTVGVMTMRLKYCLVDVLKVEVLSDYRLSLEFEDGRQGTVEISQLVPFEGIFDPLKDKRFFSRVMINRDTGTICWENGADLSPLYLYENLQ